MALQTLSKTEYQCFTETLTLIDHSCLVKSALKSVGITQFSLLYCQLTNIGLHLLEEVKGDRRGASKSSLAMWVIRELSKHCGVLGQRVIQGWVVK